MADIVSPTVRSRMMAGIRGKDTRPERLIRSALFRRGFRFRLHDRRLPGSPDLVLAKHRAVVFVHGCFWHGHDCALFRWPASNHDFWREKIMRNRAVDERTTSSLHKSGWRIAYVWECALKGAGRIPDEQVCDRLTSWLRAEAGPHVEIRGTL
jgi:DNA mismatch endonuclease (patch repair protein)